MPGANETVPVLKYWLLPAVSERQALCRKVPEVRLTLSGFGGRCHCGFASAALGATSGKVSRSRLSTTVTSVSGKAGMTEL